MARRKPKPETQVEDYRHDAKRKNLPPAALAGQGKVQELPATRYSYDPHLPPVLRFDPTGGEDALPELLAEAQNRPLTAGETRLLDEALRNHQPWLEWAGKRESRGFNVDPVALHIHERVSAQAIIKLAEREPLQPSLFADPELEYRQAVQFYQHDVDWANRLILGDSLTVMHSLARREDLAGKVQMIYLDPPYGIKFRSNFQPFVKRRTVKDRAADLTREPEQVKAYRDTWTLGVHSYLAYLRDRLMVAKEMLTDSGSIFVQIGEENLHRLRLVLDEVFGHENFIATITYRTSIGLGSKFIDPVTNYVLWFAKNRDMAESKFHRLYRELTLGNVGATRYIRAESIEGMGSRLLSSEERADPSLIPNTWKPFTDQGLTSRSGSNTTRFPVLFQGKKYRPTVGGWRTNADGIERLLKADRILKAGTTLRFKKFFDDFGTIAVTNFWDDVSGGIQSRTDPKIYVVQTANTIIERCMLMATDPGDLVLDPTCGSGTTAYVAEQWGRRWITIDTSRVAIALARQRLLTAKFDYYELADAGKGIASGLVYKKASHITLGGIAQNTALDPVFEKWEPLLNAKLAALNAALVDVTPELRTQLAAKLEAKVRAEGQRAVTAADECRWKLPDPTPGPSPKPGEGRGWEHWQVPFDPDPDWPDALAAALRDYRETWRAKMDEVNATIAASAPSEVLVDQPTVVRNVLRVSGPFTVEGVQPAEELLDLETPISGAPEELESFPPSLPGVGAEATNAAAYLEKMIVLLRKDGLRFPDNKTVAFDQLEPLTNSILHAHGTWKLPSSSQGKGMGVHRVAVSFGPQYGPITAKQIEACLWAAARSGYDDLVFAGFTIDGAAQGLIQDDPNPRVRCHLAHIRPDVQMGDLLKDTPGSQLFTVFGLPRVKLETTADGEYVVTMEGVDVYDPVTNTLHETKASKVAAWFLDSDYNGRTFCITQAFFPDSSAWDKLARALKSTVDPARFAAFSGTTSLPFQAGKHRRIAIKVIDPRGNEVMRLLRLEGEVEY